jgi:hypothetical protein
LPYLTFLGDPVSSNAYAIFLAELGFSVITRSLDANLIL